MAEPPIDPIASPPGGDGENGRIDRDIAQLGPNQKMNMGMFFGFVGLAAVLLMWGFGLFSSEPVEEEKETTGQIQTQPPPPVRQPTPTIIQEDPYVPPAPPPPFDEMAAERERLLLLRVQGLQKQLFERRRSKMLVVSDPTAQQSTTAAPIGGAGTTLPVSSLSNPLGGGRPEEDSSIRLGDVGPVLEQDAVAARLLRTTAYTITEGTIIPGILETAINSQLPGLVRGLNSADVYSHDGSQLLIPKGSRLVGRYQSDIRRGQVRVFIIWTRIIRADGLSVLINSPGTDTLGRAGLEGDVDTHFFKIFGAAILLSVLDTGLDIGLEVARDQGSGNTNIGQGSSTSGLDRAGEIALQDSIRIQPTIHIDQGTRISIMVARDLDFEAVEAQRAAAGARE